MGSEATLALAGVMDGETGLLMVAVGGLPGVVPLEREKLGSVGGFYDAQKIASHECPYIKYVYIGRISFPKVAGIRATRAA